MIYKILLSLIFIAVVFAPKASAAIPFGSGAYVNLCGSGTAANIYSCTAACNVRTGSCGGANNGVVKYVCNGRWDQCLESESYWSNYAEIGQISCGKTVQLSVYDKKCRLDSGAWDPTCKLNGYMVWHSGDCQTGIGTTPTVFPTSTVAPTPRITPTPTVRVSATLTPTPRITGAAGAICNKSCVLDSECGAGFKCLGGSCRNPSCSTDETCFCGTSTTSATTSGKKKSPDTGGEEIILLVGIVGLIGAGIVSRRVAGRVW